LDFDVPRFVEVFFDIDCAIGEAVKYSSAGTIEFLVDKNLDFYFLEMNTRIQVEHPVTEFITGIDIVEEQLQIAAGEKLWLDQSDMKAVGHAIECRIYAEDPANNFLPSPGKFLLYQKPIGKYIRVDDAMTEPFEVTSHFDPMIAKLVCYGHDREQARTNMLEALENYGLHGIKNNIAFLHAILSSKEFITNDISTCFCSLHKDSLLASMEKDKNSIPSLLSLSIALAFSNADHVCSNSNALWQTIGYWRIIQQPVLEINDKLFPCTIKHQNTDTLVFETENQTVQVHFTISDNKNRIELQLNGEAYSAFVSHPENGRYLISLRTHTFEVVRKDILPFPTEFNLAPAFSNESGKNISSPMPGKVIKILVNAGDEVAAGDLLMVVEAMKMENNILSPTHSTVEQINIQVGDLVDTNTTLIHLSNNT